jgi:ABC-type antimicrobial peptide transport system permease subunit
LATLSNFFGLLAALLVSLGVYGVMSYMVLQRTNEIGIRLALGADRGAIMSLILREAGKLLAFGLILGTLMSLTVTKAASSLLFGVKTSNPFILMAVIVGLSVIVVGASFLPTRRASRLDPMVALRYE